MKRLVLYFILFFAAVALSPFLIGEKGYILIAMGDITIESTVVTASIFLVILFVALLLSLKIFRGGIRLGKGTWFRVTTAAKRKAERQFKQGVSAYLLEDYAQAEQLLIKSADNSTTPSVAYSLAASAAHAQGENANTEYYLDCLAKQVSASDSLEQILVIIKQQLKLKNHAKARALIDEYHKHIGHDTRLLILDIELSLIEQRFEHVIDVLPQVEKIKTFNQTRLHDWQYATYLGQFEQLISRGEQAKLVEYWQGLARKTKQKQAIVLAYCHVLAKYNLTQVLESVLLPALKFDASSEFVKQLRFLPITQCQSLIAVVQKHLHKDNHSSQWLSCLGFLAFADKQFDMAAKAYASLFHQKNGYDQHDAQLYAKVLMAKNAHEQANKVLLEYAIPKL